MQTMIRFLGLVACLALPAGLMAATDYAEGFEYQAVTPPQPTSTQDKIEVVEMFWYGCPHCNRFEPKLVTWLGKKPENVKFLRIPAVLRPNWELHAYAFYVAENLGVIEKTHQAMYDALHKAGRTINTPQALKQFFMEHGVSGDDFTRAFNSFAVKSQVQRAAAMTRRYGITGVPTMVVNGKFRTTAKIASLGDVPKDENMLKVVEHLVKLEAAKTPPR